MSWVATAAAAGSVAIKVGHSISQNNKAKKIKANRPEYKIPQEAYENKAMYQNMANSSRLPGQSVLENNIGASGAGAMNAVMQAGSSSTDILSNLSKINQNQNDQYNNLAVQGAQFQADSKDKLAQANQVLAGYQDQAFDYNKNQPYMMAMARKMALQQASSQNLMSAADTVGNTAASFIGAGTTTGANARTAKNPTGQKVSGYPSQQLYG